jgi:hypothetical protein
MDELSNNVCYIIDTIYMQVGCIVFRQTIGFHILGTNCAQLLADWFLFTYECDYLVQLAKTDIQHARKFDNYLHTDNTAIKKHIHRIYPEDLILKPSLLMVIRVGSVSFHRQQQDVYTMRNLTSSTPILPMFRS